MRTSHRATLAEDREARIRDRLFRSRESYASIARRLGVTREYVGQVARGQRNSKAVQKAIARAAGVPFRQLWEAA